MTNHPNRSRKNRTVTYKIVEGGGLCRCPDETTSDLAIRVTGVPADVRDATATTSGSRIADSLTSTNQNTRRGGSKPRRYLNRKARTPARWYPRRGRPSTRASAS